MAATPVARRLAREHGIDLAGLEGSGPAGRIVEADVEAALARGREGVPLTGMRRAIGERLQRSVTEAVSCTLTREVEVSRLGAARQRLSEQLSSPIPWDAFFAKFLAAELRERPELNVVLAGDSLVQLEHTHIGIAVTLPLGLVVPVVRNPESEPLAVLAEAIRDLAERARAGSLRTTELEDGSSTITNLGGFGIDAFTPILNPPQSTILGIGRIRPRPVVRGSDVVVAQTSVLSLTFDHRVADGAAAAGLLEGIDRRSNDDAYLGGLG
jgi:pyruvate dehydrogenase E2 component (dihydrolipoamide acetyltransferase)